MYLLIYVAGSVITFCFMMMVVVNRKIFSRGVLLRVCAASVWWPLIIIIGYVISIDIGVDRIELTTEKGLPKRSKPWDWI